MKQTKMYLCTFEEFILVEILDTLLHKVELLNMHWKNTGLYTLAQRIEKCENCS